MPGLLRIWATTDPLGTASGSSRNSGGFNAAEWFVHMRCDAGSIGSFGLTQRLLPSLDEIARNGKGRGDRRAATIYASELRQHPPGWPLTT
jgi:hypothetical protein